jgi:hypothetical protein
LRLECDIVCNGDGSKSDDYGGSRSRDSYYVKGRVNRNSLSSTLIMVTSHDTEKWALGGLLMDVDVIVIVCPSSEIVETDETVTVATAGYVEAEIVIVEIGGQEEALLQVVEPTLVGDVVGLEGELGEVVGFDEVLGEGSRARA